MDNDDNHLPTINDNPINLPDELDEPNQDDDFYGPLHRPYEQETGEEINRLIAQGATLTEALKAPGMPDRFTVYRWLGKSPSFALAHTRARHLQMQTYADVMVDRSKDSSRDVIETETSYVKKNGEVITKIERRSDNTAVNRDRLVFDTMKWLMSRLLPNVYGDKLDVTSGGQVITPQVTVNIKAMKS